MAAIRQRETTIEKQFRQALWAAGVRYRKNVRVRGTPDVMIGRSKLVVFIDSCFWHACPYHCRRPKSNVDFWEAKFDRNRRRDRRITRYYRDAGWAVLRFWEHSLVRDLDGCVAKVAAIATRNRD